MYILKEKTNSLGGLNLMSEQSVCTIVMSKFHWDNFSLFVLSFPFSIVIPPLRYTDIHSPTAKAKYNKYSQLG
jgi:hypothetical protein